MDLLFSLVIWILVVFGATNGIVVSALLKPFRDWLNFSEISKDTNGNVVSVIPRKFNFFGKLISCPMCMSFWLAIPASIFLYSPCFVVSNAAIYGIQHTIGDAFLGSITSWICYLLLMEKQFKH